MNIRKGLARTSLEALPSLFDIVVVAYLVMLAFVYELMPHIGVKGVSRWDAQGMVIIFGSIVMLCLSMIMEKRAEWKSIPLGLLLIWALVVLYRKSFGYAAAFEDWWNWNLLNEGFIYLLFGVLMIRTIVCYAKNYRLYYIPIIALMGAHLIWCFKTWSMTPILAVGIAGILVLIARRKWWILGWVVILTIAVITTKWGWLAHTKFPSRPHYWAVAIHDIMQHPFGNGFTHTIERLYGWVDGGPSWGWGYIQNDLLELGRNLGIPAMILFLWFIWDIFSDAYIGSISGFIVLCFLISSLFQRTLHFNLQAGVFLVAIALFIRSTIDAVD